MARQRRARMSVFRKAMAVMMAPVCPQRSASEPQHAFRRLVMKVYHFPLPVASVAVFFDEEDLYLLASVVLWALQGIIVREGDRNIFESA